MKTRVQTFFARKYLPLFLLLTPALSYAQFREIPDSGNLAEDFQILWDQRSTNFTFPKSVTDAWGEWGKDPETGRPAPPRSSRWWDTEASLGQRKLRALIEVLIYRKVAVESLLQARQSLRSLGASMGISPHPDFVFTEHLREALKKEFSQQMFGDMHADFVSHLKNNVDIPQFRDGVTTKLWRSMVREAFIVVKSDAVAAHLDERISDVTGENESLTDEERWKRWCTENAETIESSPLLTAQSATTPELRLRSEQNRRLATMLTSKAGTSFIGERLLYTPFEDTTAFMGKPDILDAVNSVRPTKAHKGTLANWIVALVLQEAGYDINPPSKEYPRSELACYDWDLLWENYQVHSPSDRTLEHVKTLVGYGILKALDLNEKALLYLLEMPKNPEDLLFKFIDLVPIFHQSDELLEQIRKDYGLGDQENLGLRDSLLRIYERRQERLRAREHWVDLYRKSTIAAIVLTGGALSEASLFLLLISESVVYFHIIQPDADYAKGLYSVYAALYLNVEPEWLFKITPENLRDKLILDHETQVAADSAYFWLWFSGLSGTGIWAAHKAIERSPAVYKSVNQGLQRMIRQPMLVQWARSWAGTLPSGQQVFRADSVSMVHRRLMEVIQFLNTSKVTEFVELAQRIVNSKEWTKKIMRFFPDEAFEEVFPDVYEAMVKDASNARMMHFAEARIGTKKFPAEVIEASKTKLTREELIEGLRLIWLKARDIKKAENNLDAVASFDGLLRDFSRANLEVFPADVIQRKGLKPYAFWFFAQKTYKMEPTETNSRVLQFLLSTNQEHRAHEAVLGLDEVEKLLKKEQAKYGYHPKRPDINIAHHIQHMRNVLADIRESLLVIPFEDTSSPGVRWWLKKPHSWEGRPWLGKFLSFARMAHRAFNLPWYVDKIPLEAFPESPFVRAVYKRLKDLNLTDNLEYAAAQEAAGVKRSWIREHVVEGKPTARTSRWDKRLYDAGQARSIEIPYHNWEIPIKDRAFLTKDTATRFATQVLPGAAANFVGDRWGRDEFWHGDGGATTLNIVMGTAVSLFSHPISTMNLTLWDRTRYTAAAAWAGQMAVSFTANAVKLKVFDGTPWSDLVSNLFDPECLLAIATRQHFAMPFYGFVTAPRRRAYWVGRNVAMRKEMLKNPSWTGGNLFVISAVDGAIGSWALAKASRTPDLPGLDPIEVHAEGICNPVRDLFRQEWVKKPTDPKDTLFIRPFIEDGEKADPDGLTAFSRRMAKEAGMLVDVPDELWAQLRQIDEWTPKAPARVPRALDRFRRHDE